MPSNLPGEPTTDNRIPYATGILLTALLLFCMFGALFITPLRNKRESMIKEIEATKEELKAQSARLHEILAQPNDNDSELLCQSLLHSLPLPAQVACPAVLIGILKSHGIASPRVSLMAHLLFPASSQFTLSCWKTHSSAPAFPELIEAIADLENQLPLSQISDIQFKPTCTNRPPFTDIVIQIPAPN